jgi:ankyrin repeat protein
MTVLATLLKILGVAWITLGWLLVILIVALAWFRKGFGEVQTMLNPSNFGNLVAIGMILGPGIALLYLADAVRQRSRGMVLKGAIGLVVAIGLLIGVMFVMKKTTAESSADNRIREYKASSLRVLNQSATMHEDKNYFITQTRGPVGKEGIPEAIKLGDTVTVKGKTIHVKHIFVTDYLAEMKWGGQVLAKKGDVRCVVVESEENLPYGDDKRNRLWIYVEQCQPLQVSETSASARETTGATVGSLDPLYEAIGAGRLDDVKRLTASTNWIDKTDPGRPGPLFYAIMKKRETIALHLVEKGANVNADFEGVTPLFIVVMEHYTDLASEMIRKGADINARQSGKLSGGGTPFFLALGLQTYREDEIVELFLKSGQRPDVLVEDPHGRSALVWCIVNGHSRIAIWSLEQGAKVDSVDKQGQTPLQHAVYRGEVEITRELLRRKARSEVRDSNGLTVLMQALVYFRQSPTTNYLQVANLLVQHGADVRAKSRMGDTPLMFAAAVNSTDLATEMLNRGADVNAQNASGQTALMAAAAHGYLSTVEMLLTRGARADIRAKDGKTALTLARDGGSKDVESYLRSKGVTD